MRTTIVIVSVIIVIALLSSVAWFLRGSHPDQQQTDRHQQDSKGFDPEAFAVSTYKGGDLDKLYLNVDTKVEPPQAMAALIIHESMHQDDLNGQDEEIIACAVEAAFYGRILLNLSDPEMKKLIETQTPLVVRENNLLMLLLASGKHPWKPGLLDPSPEKRSLYRGLKIKVMNFSESMRRLYAALPEEETPGHKLPQSSLERILQRQTPMLNFNQETIELLDSDFNFFEEAEVRRLWQAFRPTLEEVEAYLKNEAEQARQP